MNSEKFQNMYGKPGYELHIYGSAASGLCSKLSSDLDLTILIEDFNESHEKILQMIMNALLDPLDLECRYQIEPNMPRRDQSGYILRMCDTKEKMKIDLMVNKTSEILHAQLFM